MVAGFNPAMGHEPARFRPAVVASATRFNRSSNLTVVIPVMSAYNGYPMHEYLEVSERDIRSWACIEQMKAMDLSARGCKKLGTVDEEVMSNILNKSGRYSIFDEAMNRSSRAFYERYGSRPAGDGGPSPAGSQVDARPYSSTMSCQVMPNWSVTMP